MEIMGIEDDDSRLTGKRAMHFVIKQVINIVSDWIE